MTLMQKVYWDSHCEPIRTNLAKIIYDLRRDGEDDLLMDSVEPRDFYQEYGRLEFDALVTPYNRIERKMQIMRRFLDRASDTLKVRTDTPEAPGLEITQPFKRNGTVQVAAIFYLTDGQTITIMFHNPDTTPGKLAPNDALVSWKWMINKKDVTIAVAPESGKDLDVNEVGRRIMKLAEKNSKAFQRANVKRTERLARLEANDKMIADLERQLNKLLSDLQVAKDECEAAEIAYNDAKKAADERAKAKNSVAKYGHPKPESFDEFDWQNAPLGSVEEILDWVETMSQWEDIRWDWPESEYGDRLKKALTTVLGNGFSGTYREKPFAVTIVGDEWQYDMNLDGKLVRTKYMDGVIYRLREAYENGTLALGVKEPVEKDDGWEADKAYCERVINGELAQMGEVTEVIDKLVDIGERAEASNDEGRVALVAQAFDIVQQALVAAAKQVL